MSELRMAVHRASKGFRGGVEALAAAMSSPDRKVNAQILRNQLVGNERHHLTLDAAEMIVDLCDSDELAHAAAAQRGGVFVKLPASGQYDRDELLAKFNDLYAKLGELSETFRRSVADGEIDAEERRDLTKVGQRIHGTVEELLALTFDIYCRPGDESKGR